VGVHDRRATGRTRGAGGGACSGGRGDHLSATGQAFSASNQSTSCKLYVADPCHQRAASQPVSIDSHGWHCGRGHWRPCDPTSYASGGWGALESRRYHGTSLQKSWHGQKAGTRVMRGLAMERSAAARCRCRLAGGRGDCQLPPFGRSPAYVSPLFLLQSLARACRGCRKIP